VRASVRAYTIATCSLYSLSLPPPLPLNLSPLLSPPPLPSGVWPQRKHTSKTGTQAEDLHGSYAELEALKHLHIQPPFGTDTGKYLSLSLSLSLSLALSVALSLSHTHSLA